jgi:hypothetical protein
MLGYPVLLGPIACYSIRRKGPVLVKLEVPLALVVDSGRVTAYPEVIDLRD